MARNKSPQTFEKRQRERRKQMKRQEKQARRLERNREKRLFKDRRENAIYYSLLRGGDEHLVETEVWLCVLDLAAIHGWVPAEPLGTDESDAPTYVRPIGMTISAAEAQNLAQSVEAEIPRLAEEIPPVDDLAFGEEHTSALLALRVEGQVVPEEEVQAAREILSGLPRQEVEQLVNFLTGGAFDIDMQ